MAWNGSGVFARTKDWTNDRDGAIKILASRHDENDDELTTGINACITRNNEAKPTANFAPNADASYSLGTAVLKWTNAFLSAAVKFVQSSFTGTLQATTLTADRTWSMPDVAGTVLVDISNQTALTAPATDDLLITYDTSATAHRKITTANYFKVINELTEDASPALASDFVVTYDASASAAKKVKLSAISGTIPSAADQAGMEAGSSNTTYVTPGRVRFSPFVPKAWGLYNGSTQTLVTSVQVSSVTRSGAGSYTVNWSTAMSSANYVVVVTVDGNLVASVTSKLAGSCVVSVQNVAGAASDGSISFILMGDE
jgi:hypothetical protein